MPYSTQTLVEDWGQFTLADIGAIGSGFPALIVAIMAYVDNQIDRICDVPDQFFDAGGVILTNELHDSDGSDEFKTEHSPIITVTTLEYNAAALAVATAWTALLQGPGVNTNFLVYLDEGRIYIYNTVPSQGEQRIRITYVAGYAATPATISQLSARITAAIIQRIIDNKDRIITQSGDITIKYAQFRSLFQSVFTNDLRKELTSFVDVRIGSG